MKVILIEDEVLAAEKLERLIKKYDSNIQIVERFDSVSESSIWLGDPDNNAFKLNSIDYLLKPVSFDDLFTSMKKLENMKASLAAEPNLRTFENLSQVLSKIQKNYKTRFMIKVGEKLRSFTSQEIDLFYSEGRDVFILLKEGKHYIIDYKMEELEELLNPDEFFRIGRSFIVNINAISGVNIHSNSRLKVKLHQETDKDLIVSREKVNDFKDWFSGNQREV